LICSAEHWCKVAARRMDESFSKEENETILYQSFNQSKKYCLSITSLLGTKCQSISVCKEEFFKFVFYTYQINTFILFIKYPTLFFTQMSLWNTIVIIWWLKIFKYDLKKKPNQLLTNFFVAYRDIYPNTQMKKGLYSPYLILLYLDG
jgi:hypothetical protein